MFAPRSSPPLAKFKAGKLERQGKTLKANNRKGSIIVEKKPDGTVTFCWSERGKSTPEDNLIIFPNEVEFLPITNCPSGRAFALKFLTSSQRYYYWLQEAKGEEFGEEFILKMNRILNNRRGVNVTKQAPEPKATGGFEQGPGKAKSKSQLSLTKVLTVENLSTLLGNSVILEKFLSFIPPELPKTKDELESIVRSPQFLQTLTFLDESLRSGDLAPLLVEMGIDPSIGPLGGVEAFLRALQEKYDSMT